MNLLLIGILAISPGLQSFLAKKTTLFISNIYDIDLNIDKVYLKFPNKLVLDNVQINDSIGNPVLISEKIDVSISSIKFFSKKLFVNKITIKKSLIDIYTDKNGIDNYSCIFNKFITEKQNKDTIKTKGFDIFCNEFSLKDNHFKYIDYRKEEDSLENKYIWQGFNTSNINVKGINLTVKDIKIEDTIQLQILNFSFNEQSGVNLKDFSVKIKYFDNGISLKDLALQTRNSRFLSSNIELKGSDADYLSDPINKLTAKISFDTVIFDVSDLSPFLPEYKDIHEYIHLSGDFSGKLSNIKVKDISINFGQNTRLFANISIDGLPNYEETFIFGNISDVNTNANDLARILEIVSPNNPIILPKGIYDIEYINFNGNLTGLLNDAVAYGEFNTGYGDIKTDIAIVSDFDTKKIFANGKINATNIKLGNILNDTLNFGQTTLTAKLNGSIDSLSNFLLDMDCDLAEIEIMNYNYSNIKIDGILTNNSFNGGLIIDDPNLHFQFLGKYNYNTKKKQDELSCSADLWANLSNLNILPDTANSEIKFVFFSNLYGDFSDIPQGDANVNQFKFNMNDKSFVLNQFEFKNFFDNLKNQNITLRSDYCDINLLGNYKINELINIFTEMAYNYLPAFVEKPKIIKKTVNNTAQFDIKLKKLDKICYFFLPELYILDNILIEGNITGNISNFTTSFNIPDINYDRINISNTKLNIAGYLDSLDININSQKVNSNNFSLFENLNLNFDLKHDTLLYALNWADNDSIKNEGNLKLKTIFQKNQELTLPKILNTVYNSKITIQNRSWEISESNVDIDLNNQNIIFNNFSVKHLNQSILLDGEVSNDKSKILKLQINNINVSNFNTFIESSGYKLGGIINGSARVADVYNDINFRTSLSIDALKINDENFDKLELSVLRNGAAKGLEVDASNKYFKIRGIYMENNNIDLSIFVNNFKTELIAPYLQRQGISKVNGSFDIDINAKGNISDPDVSGFVKFNNTELTYDLLQLRATLNDKVSITKNAFLFNNFKFTDDKKNSGTINGGIYHKNFSGTNFDLKVSAKNMKLLNTTAKDNSSYYGTAYADADVRFSGNVDKFGIDAVVKTNPNTLFVLPMVSSYEGKNISYLTFLKSVNDSTETKKIQAIESGSEYYIKLDIEVTPSAEVQIVFDPKVGDIIRANAKGNLKIEYNSNEELSMYGDIEIVEGDYLFTLENIMNKRFYINNGGTIVWSGDPYNADINLEAKYSIKASLKELMMDMADTASNNNYNSLVNVECILKMTGKLMTPDIQFRIDIPNANDKVKAQLTNMSQDEINKQLVFLLVMNRFYSVSQDGSPSDMGNSTSAFGTTSLEILSNQVSNWLSQISKSFDVGFKYFPGTDITGQEFELALSTQILNDRVLINGNLGYGDKNQINNSNMAGDIEIQYKVNPSGSFRIKGFSRTNNDIYLEYGPYTSGTGVFYTRDFNTWGEFWTGLFKDVWNGVTLNSFREKSKNRKKDRR